MTPDLGGVASGATWSLMEDFDLRRLTSLEGSRLSLQVLVEEQGEWLRRQSALLNAQRALIETLAEEQDALRSRVRDLEDRTTLLEVAQPETPQMLPQP